MIFRTLSIIYTFNNTKWCKKPVIAANGYSSESTQWELSNEYQHDRVSMIFKNLCILVRWTKVASALEELVVSLPEECLSHGFQITMIPFAPELVRDSCACVSQLEDAKRVYVYIYVCFMHSSACVSQLEDAKRAYVYMCVFYAIRVHWMPTHPFLDSYTLSVSLLRPGSPLVREPHSSSVSPLLLAECSNPKKCRARFGLDAQGQWCKPCRWVSLSSSPPLRFPLITIWRFSACSSRKG